MKKKKILLTGLLGVSILAAGITLASCNSIPLTPYEPSSTTVPVPTPSSTSVVPTPSSVDPVTPSTSEVTPSSSEVTPTPSSSQETPEVGNEVSFDATELTTGDTYVQDTTDDTTEEKAEVTEAELCNGFFTQVIEGEGKVVKRSKQYKVGDVKHYSSECVAIEASAGCGLEFTVTHAVKLSLSLQSTSSSNKSIFALFKDDVAVAAKTTGLTDNGTSNHYVITGASVAIEYELEAGTYEMLYLNEKAAEADSATVNRGGRFFTIKTEEIELAPVVQTYTITYDANGHGTAPAAVANVTSYPETLPTLTADGFQFLGWATTNDATEADVTAGGEISGDVTLYAVWRQLAQPVTVTFVTGVDGITFDAAQTEKGGKLAVLPSLAETVTDYVLKGFYTDDTYQTPFTTDTVVEENMNVYVKLAAVYTVSFETAYGEAPTDLLRQEKIVFENLPTMANVDYYIFKGWLLNDELLTADAELSGAVTLTASWEQQGTTTFVQEMLKDDSEYLVDAYNMNPYKSVLAVRVLDSDGNDVDSYEKAYVLVDTDGKIIVQDESSTETVYGYLMQGISFTSGKVVVATDITLNALGGNWAFLNVQGTDTAKTSVGTIFSLGFNGDKVLTHLIDDNGNNFAAVDADHKASVAAKTKFAVKLVVDFEASTISYSIDGKDIATATVEGLSSVEGLSFKTAKSATDRHITVDNTKIDFYGSLDQYKAIVSGTIDKVVASMEIDTIYSRSKTQIEGTIADYKEQIQGVTSYDDVIGKYEELLLALVQFETDDEMALKEAKESALNEIHTLVASKSYEMNYEMTKNQTNLPEGMPVDTYDNFYAYIKTYDYGISDCESIAAVETLKGSILTSMTNTADDSTSMVEYYASFKKNELKSAFKSTDYTEDNSYGLYEGNAPKTDYDAAFATYDASAITDKATIDAAYSAANTSLAQIKTDAEVLELAQTAALNQLTNYKTTEIALEEAETQTDIAGYKTAGQTAIEAATKVSEVNAALTTAKANVDSLIVPLATVISNYNLAITNDVEGDSRGIKNKLLDKIANKNDFVKDKVTNLTPIEVDSTTATTKSLAKQQYEAIVAALAALESEFDDKETAKANLDTYVSGAVATLLDQDAYASTYATEMEGIVSTQKTNINTAVATESPAVTLAEAIAAAYTAATGAVDTEISTIKSATEVVVTFKDGTTTVGEPVSIKKGTAVDEKTGMEKDGYVFAYWCSDAELTTEFEFTTTLDTNTTLYAKWYDSFTYNETINSVYDFTTLEAQKSIQTATTYGAFTLSNGEYTQFYEQVGYLSLYSGNTVTFTVQNDGAIFLMSLKGNSTTRYVKLSSSNSLYNENIQYQSGTYLKPSTAGSQRVQTFNNENYTLEVSSKGWFVFDNLLKGTYTLTFDEDGDNAGKLGKAECKVERMRLLDRSISSVAVNDIIATITPSDTSISITNVKLVSTNNVQMNSVGHTIEVRDSGNNLVPDYSANLNTNSDYTVTLKYGTYVLREYNVTTLAPIPTITTIYTYDWNNIDTSTLTPNGWYYNEKIAADDETKRVAEYYNKVSLSTENLQSAFTATVGGVSSTAVANVSKGSGSLLYRDGVNGKSEPYTYSDKVYELNKDAVDNPACIIVKNDAIQIVVTGTARITLQVAAGGTKGRSIGLKSGTTYLEATSCNATNGTDAVEYYKKSDNTYWNESTFSSSQNGYGSEVTLTLVYDLSEGTYVLNASNEYRILGFVIEETVEA